MGDGIEEDCDDTNSSGEQVRHRPLVSQPNQGLMIKSILRD